VGLGAQVWVLVCVYSSSSSSSSSSSTVTIRCSGQYRRSGCIPNLITPPPPPPSNNNQHQQVVEPDQLLPAAYSLAGRIAATSPSAVSATLSMLRSRLPWDQLQAAAEDEAAKQAVFFKQPDCLEGVESVKSKRKAVFQPRKE